MNRRRHVAQETCGLPYRRLAVGWALDNSKAARDGRARDSDQRSAFEREREARVHCCVTETRVSLVLHTFGQWLPSISVVIAIGLSSGCAFSTRPPGLTANQGKFVRKVDCSQAPDMKESADHARKIGDDAYPKILSLLVDDASTVPQQIDIIFKPLGSRNTGETHLKSRSTSDAKVFINANYFSTNSAGLHWVGKDPANFEFVLVHELVHVVQ